MKIANAHTRGRLELKFCVPDLVAIDALDFARAHLDPEPLAQGHQQRVTSLYLDTPDLTFLRWHRERAGDRYKLRIRRYGDLPVNTLFVEVKFKTKSVGRKYREAFDAHELDTVVGRCLEEYGATPQTLVSSVREALRDPAMGTAVTVDRALRFQPIRHGDLVGATRAWRALPVPPCSDQPPALLELKYEAGPPVWMSALIDRLAPWRVSYSKYATAMTCANGDIPEAAPTESLSSSAAGLDSRDHRDAA
jgi:hypothetical protein